MANCNSVTLTGLSAICKEGKGGVLKVWMAPFIGADAITLDDDANIATFDTDTFVCYEFRRNSASLTSNLEVNDNAGNTYTTEVTLDFLKQDPAKRLEVSAILAAATTVVVEDANGVGHLLGATYPVEASAATVETGTAVSDANHYNFTLRDQDDHLPYIVSDTTMGKLHLIKPAA